MALAFLTKCMSIERGTSNVYFHIDHKLRKESKKEALFIKKILKNKFLSDNDIQQNAKNQIRELHSIKRVSSIIDISKLLA